MSRSQKNHWPGLYITKEVRTKCTEAQGLEEKTRNDDRGVTMSDSIRLSILFKANPVEGRCSQSLPIMVVELTWPTF